MATDPEEMKLSRERPSKERSVHPRPLMAVRVFDLYPIKPGRFSNQYRTGADRCTPTLPR